MAAAAVLCDDLLSEHCHVRRLINRLNESFLGPGTEQLLEEMGQAMLTQDTVVSSPSTSWLGANVLLLPWCQLHFPAARIDWQWDVVPATGRRLSVHLELEGVCALYALDSTLIPKHPSAPPQEEEEEEPAEYPSSASTIPTEVVCVPEEQQYDSNFLRLDVTVQHLRVAWTPALEIRWKAALGMHRSRPSAFLWDFFDFTRANSLLELCSKFQCQTLEIGGPDEQQQVQGDRRCHYWMVIKGLVQRPEQQLPQLPNVPRTLAAQCVSFPDFGFSLSGLSVHWQESDAMTIIGAMESFSTGNYAIQLDAKSFQLKVRERRAVLRLDSYHVSSSSLAQGGLSSSLAALGDFSSVLETFFGVQSLAIFSERVSATDVFSTPLELENCKIDLHKSTELGMPLALEATTVRLLPELMQLSDVSVYGVLSTNQIDNLEVTINEMVVSSKIHKLLLDLGSEESSSIPPLDAPFAKVSQFKCFYNVQRDLTRLVRGKASDEIDSYLGDEATTLAKLIQFYGAKLASRIEERRQSASTLNEGLVDSVATRVGQTVLGVGLASPIGLAAGCAALGVKDGVAGAVAKGKESRGVETDERYKFGDFSRGVASSFRRGSSSRDSLDAPANDESSQASQSNDEANASRRESYFARNKSRYGAVAGSTAGAMVGLAVAGPVGLIAGSLIGATATKSFIDRKNAKRAAEDEVSRSEVSHDECGLFEPVSNNSTTDTGDQPPPTTTEQGDSQGAAAIPNESAPPVGGGGEASSSGGDGYRFGDIARGLIARGKQASGRDEASEYRFGDFTRGLFASRP